MQLLTLEWTELLLIGFFNFLYTWLGDDCRSISEPWRIGVDMLSYCLDMTSGLLTTRYELLSCCSGYVTVPYALIGYIPLNWL